MATLRQIRRRIRTVENTAKITKAMELVAASKMRRAQTRALAGRPYAEKMRSVLASLAETLPLQDPEAIHPLMRRRQVQSIDIILITPDRGLCGGLPANLNRHTASFIVERQLPARLICIGRKGRDFFRRSGAEIVAEFIGLGDYPGYEDVRPAARVAMDDYTYGLADEVYLSYALFVNTMVQRPQIFKLLPVEPPAEVATWEVDYIYEPSRESIMAELLPRYVERQLYEALLEALASEQSARMVAMRSATDNANDMIRELTLTYNKARQESITKELLELTGGAEILRTER
ncbi:MAG: ATP F0F1 synthase subunit gamma [Dehalococcoidia bacterium SM23_28_2]|nr:MAG: ATP F0F1 synthase subunit gamma [Dehalococcoidia bacterium SM23_28_2]